jgi:1,4-dihydroxy-2-naphthoyl-CoA synthase
MRERMPTLDELLCEKPADQVGRITLNRPEAHNAHFSGDQDLADRTADGRRGRESNGLMRAAQ